MPVFIAGLIIMGVTVVLFFKLVIYVILPLSAVALVLVILDGMFLQPFIYNKEMNSRPPPSDRSEEEKRKWDERWTEHGVRRKKDKK